MTRRLTWYIVLLVVASSGCGYALAGRGNALPAYIHTIGVPGIANQSTTASIEQMFTEAMRSEFQSRGRYVVRPDDTGVDAVLTAVIANVRILPSALNANSQVTTNTIIVTATVEFKDLHENRVLWSNPSFLMTDVFPVASSAIPNDPNTLFRLDATALERLSKRFAREVVAAVFEAF